MIKVLLVAPVDPEVPGDLKFLVGGESTYTKTLLNFPPEGVDYIHHSEALRKGLIAQLSVSKVLDFLVKFRILPLSSGNKCFRIRGNFDLIHCHGYSIKTVGKKIPIILSDSSSNYLFLKDYVNWPTWRIKIGYALRRFLFGLLGVVDADTNLEKAKKLMVFSQFAKKIHLRLGAPKRKIEVVPAGLPSLSRHPGSHEVAQVNILFVGTWFERKGGPILLEAFRRLCRKYKNIRLTIVGPIPKRLKEKFSLRSNNNIAQFDYVPRERLMREFFPKADIFVLVPPKVEGFGFVVLEAMSFGIPVVVSNVCALPELVDDRKTGFVITPGSVEDLADKLETLIADQSLRDRMGKAARKRFEEKFTVKKSNQALLAIYRQALL